MFTDFDLEIDANTETFTAEFRLKDGAGAQVGYQRTEFAKLDASRLEALFDLREHLNRLVDPGKESAELARLGVDIAKDVLGGEIFEKLWKPRNQRTLRILLPRADQAENSLAAALARVPWEMARPTPDESTLLERNLLVRVVHAMAEPATRPLDLGDDESLRVLFVFAAARASTPLAARRERRALQRLFEEEIYSCRRVQADFLTQGVTRERLRAQVQVRKGYHIVHWSGHGHLNALELAGSGGSKDSLEGDDLRDLFADAGGFIPRLIFLSACHSGEIANIKDWEAFIKAAREKPAAKEAAPKEFDPKLLEKAPGFTGTAHALLEGGAPSIVAMRYSVGDEYACDLGVEFYRALLAHDEPKDVAAALTMARKTLLARQEGQGHYAACDHATPMLYGSAQPHVTPPDGRGPNVGDLGQRLHRIPELASGANAHFVGRTWQLADLESRWLGIRKGARTNPVAVVVGLGGMGKTALATEALDLWERHFRFVLLFQAKPEALSLELWLSGIDQDLRYRSSAYRDHVAKNPRNSVFLVAEEGFKGARRYGQLIDNLIRALRDEPMLIVLDNFETHLKPAPEPGDGEPLYGCKEKVWDECLARLAEDLVGSGSRVLITCRRPLAALADKPSHLVRLGPLPPGEAALYLREHAILQPMVEAGGAELALAMRLLTASRFHPLLMDRLARLASPKYRPQLEQALETLKAQKDFSALPDLFATAAGAGRERELKYLDDALEASIDQLIETASFDARQLLWIIALANEPVALGLLEKVWSGDSPRNEQLRRIQALLGNISSQPPELQELLKRFSPEERAVIDAVPPAKERPDPGPLLRQLEAVGLAEIEREGFPEGNPDCSCHELVRERIRNWMEQRPADRGEFNENDIRVAYAEGLQQAFERLQHTNMSLALEAGARATVYYVQAGAYDRLGDFASGVVTGARDPRLLERLIPHLEAAAASAREGRARWTCLGNLADTLARSGRPDKSLQFYERAADLARVAAEADGEGANQAWSDFAVIAENRANALGDTGNLAAAREQYLASAEAERKRDAPEARVVGSELEALRIDILRGEAEAALPQASERLAKLRDWWEHSRRNEAVAEAPDKESLARALISALDIVRQAHFALEQWAPALDRIDEILKIKRGLQRSSEDIARTRFNRAVPLIRLQRFAEAKQELEACLEVFQSDPTMRAGALSTLADLYDKWGDKGQAIIQERRALALRNTLADPSSRAISHNNIANYLRRSGEAAALAEGQNHRLASLTYSVVADLRQDLKTDFHNYVNVFRRARGSGAPPAIPRLAELLADPAFDALARWLRERQVDLGALQANIDQFLAAAREVAEKLEESPPP